MPRLRRLEAEKRYLSVNSTKKARNYVFKWFYEVSKCEANRKRMMAMATDGGDPWGND